MSETRSSQEMSTGLARVMERARRNPDERQYSLAHLIDVDALRRAFGRIRNKAAVGVDGVTKAEYGQNLEENLQGLHVRLKTRKYRHQPIRRAHIPKDRKQTRQIGVSATEDKIVQGALSEILGAIYEQDFLDCSYGFRPGRKPHDALRALNRVMRRGGGNVILESDIVSFFDSIDRPMLREMLEERIADKSLMRLVGKCLNVGVLEGATFSKPDEGTVQGSIISPILGNVYLHNALDKWFEREVKPRMKGKAELIRYCDDFLICFEHMEDAEKVTKVLSKRLGRFNLKLHPGKTRLINFQRPKPEQKEGKGPGSFDFLGFTVYWRRNYKGTGWHVSWKTRKSRMSRAKRALNDFCKSHRHESIRRQHQALVSRIRGHFNYFGVNGNTYSLCVLKDEAERIWHKWLNRRSQRARKKWENFKDMMKDYPLPTPKVYVNLWADP